MARSPTSHPVASAGCVAALQQGERCASGGVLAEIALHNTLCDFSSGKRVGVIFHPLDDEKRRRIKAIEHVICTELRGKTGNIESGAKSEAAARSVEAWLESSDAFSLGEFRQIGHAAIPIVADFILGANLPNEHQGATNLGKPERHRQAMKNETRLGQLLFGAYSGHEPDCADRFTTRSTMSWVQSSNFVELSDELVGVKLGRKMLEILDSVNVNMPRS